MSWGSILLVCPGFVLLYGLCFGESCVVGSRGVSWGSVLLVCPGFVLLYGPCFGGSWGLCCRSDVGAFWTYYLLAFPMNCLSRGELTVHSFGVSWVCLVVCNMFWGSSGLFFPRMVQKHNSWWNKGCVEPCVV